MKFRRLELGDEAHQEQPDEQQRTDCISDIQGLSEKVAPVSPSVVAAIFMTQKSAVICGSFVNRIPSSNAFVALPESAAPTLPGTRSRSNE
jgi:hypothetical protein